MQFKNCLQLLGKLAPAEDPVQRDAAAGESIRNDTHYVIVASILTVAIKGKKKNVEQVMV